MKSALVGREPGTLDLHPAERPHVDMAVRLPAPWTAPMFELHHFFGAVRNEIIHRVLVAQPVSAGDGVVKMIIERIVGLYHGSGATLGCDCMTAHWVDF